MIDVRQHRRGRRQGVALVMVIGFLAVLVLLAVGFAVSMRIERLAAQNYSQTVRGRQLTYTALTRAMADIESKMGTQMYPTPPGYVSKTGGRTLIAGSATNYIPRSVFAVVPQTSLNFDWTDIIIPDPNQPGQNLAVGRYAYAAMDCSGLIDVNLDGTTNLTTRLPAAPGRGLGYSTRELYLDAQLLPELVPNNEVNIKSGRLVYSGENTGWVRMESVAEINPILGYYASGSPMLPGVAPSNLFVYSHAPAGWLKNGSTQQSVYLGTNDTELTQQKPAILAALQAMPGVVNPNMVMNQLIDYADADSIPGAGTPSTTIPSMEPIPMINEVVVTSRVYTAGGRTHVTNQLIVELWYPYAGYTNNQSYTLTAIAPIPPPTGATTESTPSGPNTATISGPFSSNRYITATLSLPSFYWTNGTVNWSSTQVRPALTLRDGSGNLVDAVQGATTLTIPFGSVIGTRTYGDSGNYFLGAAADDPRINWDGSAGAGQWKQMANNTHSLSNFNTGYCTALNAGKDFEGGSAANIALYVPNRPFQTAGELGLLLNFDPANAANSMWKSIRLINSTPAANDALPVLDYFTTVPTSSGAVGVARGKININSPHLGPLATAFHKAAMDAYPGEPGASQPTVAQLGTLAQQMKTSGPYINLSEIAKLGDANVPGGTPAQKEGLIRNTANLLTTRQNIFTIIVAAQSAVDSQNIGSVQDSEVVSEQRALAIVWRDPYPNARGTHDMFVRFFRWLPD